MGYLQEKKGRHYWQVHQSQEITGESTRFHKVHKANANHFKIELRIFGEELKIWEKGERIVFGGLDVLSVDKVQEEVLTEPRRGH